MKGSSYSLRVMKNAKQFNRPPAAAAHLTSLMPPTLPHTNQLQPVESISSTCPTRADISQEGDVSEQVIQSPSFHVNIMIEITSDMMYVA